MRPLDENQTFTNQNGASGRESNALPAWGNATFHRSVSTLAD